MVAMSFVTKVELMLHKHNHYPRDECRKKFKSHKYDLLQECEYMRMGHVLMTFMMEAAAKEVGGNNNKVASGDIGVGDKGRGRRG